MSNLDKAVEVLREAYREPSMSPVHACVIMATALEAAWLLMPDLPEPIEGEISGILDWFPEDCEITVYPGEKDLAHVSIKPDGVDELHLKLPLSKAGSIALALLAAAEHAEKEQDNE